jgi:diguanylate cyclase
MSVELATQVDLLTGAWKRERFEEQLARAVTDARRSQRVLSMIYIDVDELQEHNDVHGRDSLDGALSWLAAKISQVIDGAGPIGRIGDDEFAVFLPNVSLEHALRLAERLRRTVPMTLHASAFGDYRLTVCVGVASLRRSEPWGNLAEAAEDACRRAKQGGRDGVARR